MSKYNINSLLSKDKKDVELLDGTVIDLTFRPNIVNRLYSEMSDEQFEIQKVMKEYKQHMNKLKTAQTEKELEDTEKYIKDSKKIKKKIDDLTSSIQDKLKQIVKITIEHNDNPSLEIDDAWFDERTQQEINLLIQIIFDMVKEEDKKKSENNPEN